MQGSSLIKSLGPHVQVEKGPCIPDSAWTSVAPYFSERRREDAETQCLGIGSQAKKGT